MAPGRQQEPVLCGAAPPADRHHHYWACPVAQAVVTSISETLAAAGLLPAPLSKAAIWLGRAPPAVHSGVWDVVCLATVTAMDHGRRRMYALSAGPPQATPIHVTCARSSVGTFWSLLADFVVLRCAPDTWRQQLPPAHPLFAMILPHHRSVCTVLPRSPCLLCPAAALPCLGLLDAAAGGWRNKGKPAMRLGTERWACCQSCQGCCWCACRA